MNDFEMVSELVSKTGATFEEARYAYEACGKDMLSAAIMLEKAKKNHESCNGSTSSGAKGSCDSYGNSGDSWDNVRSTFRRNAGRAAHSAGSILTKMRMNTVRVVGKQEYFSISILAAALIMLVLWEIALPAVLISIFCGVRYIFTGPHFTKDFIFGFSKPQGSETGSTYTEYTEYSEASQDKGFFN